MAEAFLTLSADDRRDALAVASAATGRPAHLLEKDVWVVWALDALFASPFGGDLVFKGGTSLSKAYGVIRRFSEDVDLTYDIRAIAGDLVADAQDALPPNRSQEQKWSKTIKTRLANWVEAKIAPLIRSAIESNQLQARVRTDGEKLFIDYDALAAGTGYVSPSVMLEFGARATGEPWEVVPIACDAAPSLPELIFPTAAPQVMLAERTFWEKSTAIHVFCAQGRFRGADRFARHWHDVVRLDDAGYAEKAIADRALAGAVATHKTMFFAEKNADGEPIDYQGAVSGGLRLVPDGPALELLAADYGRMLDDGLLEDEAERFDALIARCRQIQQAANAPSP
ncbi:hypothetical protein (DUF1814) [Caulobacter sp. AP07]|uniref:nucleotidyl transferase AbiEii/AbiGii toxin family protein n=1 Tax=Caulobacter sp. AP07 TaxID=1144304 RepID=UPI00027225B6|nr:nucleotidyl transferase AbiEii/AbiGii toxin family protein [Caulobacter sp. AP07]EJL24469.1 hypothetical protein (DUF1814) [Caulobacter sp. AP07]